MGDEDDIGLIERARGFFKKKSLTPSDKVDEHLTKNLPRYVEEYKLAQRSDLEGIDKKIEEFVAEISELKDWRKETEDRIHQDRKEIEELEEKLGIEGPLKEGS